MNIKSDLYKQHLLSLAKNPQNYGLLKNSDFQSHELNPSCGDGVTICGLIKDSKILEARFEGTGCVLSLAMASLLMKHIESMTLDNVLRLDEKTVENLLQMELGINRLQCGMLSIVALQQGVRKYKESI